MTQDDAQAAGYDKGKTEGLAEGEKAERDRVTAILSVEDCDLEAQKKAITDGLSVDAAYKLFYEAERGKKADEKKALEESLKDSAGAIGKEKKKETDPIDEFNAKVKEYQEAKNCSKGDAITAVANKFPELHEAYIAEFNAQRKEAKK